MTRTIEFSPPARLLSMNDRHHWRVRHSLTREWRFAAFLTAMTAKNRGRWECPLPPAVVAVGLPVATNTRRDPANYAATVKPIVDGLVEAGLWPVEPLLLRHAERVRVVIAPRDEFSTDRLGRGPRDGEGGRAVTAPRFVDLESIEVEHLLGAATGLPLVKIRVLGPDGLVMLGQVDPTAAREIACHLFEAAAARSEYEADFASAADKAGVGDELLGMFLHMVRHGEQGRHTR